jgi:activating signal cointegrator 1
VRVDLPVACCGCEKMKALSLTQPWATAMALGIKQWETRGWPTRYRGPIAIHAAKGFPRYAREFAEVEHTLGRIPSPLPFGAIVALGQLVECARAEDVYTSVTALERLYGNYEAGRYAWRISGIVALPEPIPAKGALGLWEWRQ